MLTLPWIGIVKSDIFVFLSSFFSSNMLNGNTEQVFALVGTNMTAISKSLFLIVILNFPNDLILNNGSEGQNVRKISRVEKGFHLGLFICLFVEMSFGITD